MSKVLKLRIRRGEKNKMLYPPDNKTYQKEIGDFNEGHIYCHDRDLDICHLVMIVPDAVASKYAGTPDIEELTKEDAIVMGGKFDPKTMFLSDEARVRRLEVLTKADPTYVLTEEDKKSLDPDDDSVPGVQWKRTFADKVSEKIEVD